MSQGTNDPERGSGDQAGPIHERHRAQITARIPPWYNHKIHLVTPTLLGTAVLIFACSRIHGLRPADLLAIPATLLLGFGFEWRVHKWVLHKRVPGLGVLYDRHELQHHVVYTYDDMAMRSPRELWLILMPSYAVVLVALINAPLTFIVAKLFSTNVGFVYLATSMIFFLGYEWLHLSYHLPKTSFIGKSPIIARLRELHRRHHDPRLMKQWNFNVTFPLFDWIYRTNWSPEREREVVEKRERKRAKKISARLARPA